MERQKIKRHIENYKIEVTQSISERIIERDIGPILVSGIQAFFLLLPMLNGERWTERMHTAAIAVGAVHTAFDAHDAIDVANVTSKQQQLTVLSGDYFSGIHYRLLASLPDFGFIRSLAHTIGVVNEMKATLHGQTPDDIETLIDIVRVIEAGCIIEFLHTFGFSDYCPIVNAAMPLLWLDQTELKANDSNREQMIALLRIEMQEAIEQAHFLAPSLQQEIRRITSPLLGKPI